MTITPKVSWPGVSTLLHSVYDQSDCTRSTTSPTLIRLSHNMTGSLTPSPRSYPKSSPTSQRTARTCSRSRIAGSPDAAEDTHRAFWQSRNVRHSGHPPFAFWRLTKLPDCATGYAHTRRLRRRGKT
jgi:hypothetical protein